MREQDREIALRLKREIAKIAQIVDFRVYGSRARGDGDEYSDLDVFLVVELLDKELKEALYYAAWEVGFDNLMVISLIICTREEFEKSPLRASPLVQNVAAEGVAI